MACVSLKISRDVADKPLPVPVLGASKLQSTREGKREAQMLKAAMGKCDDMPPVILSLWRPPRRWAQT